MTVAIFSALHERVQPRGSTRLKRSAGRLTAARLHHLQPRFAHYLGLENNVAKRSCQIVIRTGGEKQRVQSAV